MDIFEWLHQSLPELEEAGQSRLCEMLWNVAGLACDDEHDALDAMMPEALALARQQNNSWFEVYLRHWNLQSRILHRMEVNDWLPEAVDLLDFAHRPENMGCPQSVCVTQDLAVAYSLIDGEGFAAERMAVAAETLERITPGWACFVCIARQYHEALVDDGRTEEALAYSLRQRDAVAEVVPKERFQRRVQGLDIGVFRARFDLGQVDQAIEEARKTLKHVQKEQSPHHSISTRLMLVHYLCHRGDEASVEEARALMPEWEEIGDTLAFYIDAVWALQGLVKVGVVDNDWILGQHLWRMVQTLASQGVNIQALDSAQVYATLALERGQPHMVRHSVALMAKIITKLRKPARFEAALDDLRAKIAEVEAAVGASRQSELEALQADEGEPMLDKLSGDPEKDLWWLQQCHAHKSADDSVMFALAQAWDALGFEDEALAVLEAGFTAHETPIRLQALGKHLLGMGDDAALMALLGPLLSREDALGISAHWLKGHRERGQDRHSEALATFRRVIELDPDHPKARLFAAEALRVEGELEEALDLLNTQIERFHADGPDEADWLRMIVATLLGRWSEVRASAHRLGFEFETQEGPIREPFQMCRVVLPTDNGGVTLWAKRDGPVTACVAQLSNPNTPQHRDDWVVFEHIPLNLPPGGIPEGEDFTPVFKAIARLESGGYRPSLPLDGFHPGDDVLESVAEAIGQLGPCAFQGLSGDQYQLPDPKGGEETVLGFYGILGIPEDVPLRAVHEVLTTVTAGLPLPLFWPELLRQLDDQDALRTQFEAMARHEIAED